MRPTFGREYIENEFLSSFGTSTGKGTELVDTIVIYG